MGLRRPENSPSSKATPDPHCNGMVVVSKPYHRDRCVPVPWGTHSTVSLFVPAIAEGVASHYILQRKRRPFPFTEGSISYADLAPLFSYCLSHSNSIDQPAGTLSHLFMTCLSSWTIHLPQTEAMPLDSPEPTTQPNR